MPDSNRASVERDAGRRMLLLAFVIVIGLGGGAVFLMQPPTPEPPPPNAFLPPTPQEPPEQHMAIMTDNMLVHWMPASEFEAEITQTDDFSNIMRQDYVGPDTCSNCHRKQHGNWSHHPHRWMNALASQTTVKGDFSGESEIVYQGARGTFYRDDDRFLMRIELRGKEHLYEIHQTLGSRFFQYYIGVGIEGPSPNDAEMYLQDHVLPFGYWLDHDMWVPIVHVANELPDEGGRVNGLSESLKTDLDQLDLTYAERCNHCHTTFPLADSMVRMPPLAGNFAPVRLHVSMSELLAAQHPQIWDGSKPASAADRESINRMILSARHLEAPEHAVTLGISCEACHLGCRAHAEGKLKKPSFLPSGEHLYVETASLPAESGRTVDNINWVCSRCHQGERPRFAGGMATWNSTEFSDASLGGCYSEMTCVHCHNPHEAIGPKWPRTAEQDDAACLKCHSTLEEPAARLAHTHHPAGTAGDHCMNCHMPKINEGLQDVVRTHKIYSPTEPEMIEAGHANACNLCHLEEPIDWTLKHLKDWYGTEFFETRITKNYPHRSEPVGRVWLTHEHESVRVIATDAASRHQDARWALPEVIDQLDDPYLLNRQFGLMAVERMLGVELSEFGYRFYMTKAERAKPLQKIREQLLDTRSAVDGDRDGDASADP